MRRSFDGDDAALTVGLEIALTDNAIQGVGDVVDQHLVVQLDAIL